jgi:transposase
VANHRLAVIRHAEEVTGNVSQTCRYFGISRQTFYVWLRRYEEKGLEGLRDRSRRPHHSPNATSAEVVGKIIYLRQSYHFGPHKIAMYLKRYHDVAISPSGVWRILCRLELNRLPTSQKHKTYHKRWKRYEKPQPGHRVQVDVKFITPIGAAGKRFYQFTAIDDCTRLRILRAYPRCNQKTAIQFLDYLLAKLPFRVEVIQTDNGAEFGSQFHYHVLDRGIRHLYIKPATPDSTARWNAPTAPTKKSSTGCSTASSSTTPTCSTTSCKSGKTSTTSTDPTAASPDKPPTNDYDRRQPRAHRCKQTPSVAHLSGEGKPVSIAAE